MLITRFLSLLLWVSAGAAQALQLDFDPRVVTPSQAAELNRQVVDGLPAGFRAKLGDVRVEFQPLDKNGYFDWIRDQVILNAKFTQANSDKITRLLTHELVHVYEHRVENLSRTRRFQLLSGWQRLSNARHHVKSTPDQYEFHHPREALAVNFESYVFDPEYSCRRPTLAAYFESVFGPLERGRTCEPEEWVPIKQVGGLYEWKNLRRLKISSLHYLLAAPGASSSTRWGHSMFRLVVCAETDRTEADCARNHDDDLVASFVFEPNGPINIPKTLTSGYESLVRFSSLPATIREYTYVDFRNVESYPIDLEAEQFNAVLTRVTEIFWFFRYSYNFLTNNCADAVLRSLAVTLGRESLPKGNVVTSPLGLKRWLLRTGLSRETGLLIPSYQGLLQTALRGIDPNYRGSVEDYLKAETSPFDLILERILTSDAPSELKLERLTQYRVLEEYRIFRLQKQLGKTFAQSLNTEERSVLQNVLQTSQVAKPYYGLPLAGDLQMKSAQEVQRVKAPMIAVLRRKYASTLEADQRKIHRIRSKIDKFASLFR